MALSDHIHTQRWDNPILFNAVLYTLLTLMHLKNRPDVHRSILIITQTHIYVI